MLRNRIVKATGFEHWLSDRMPESLNQEELPHLMEGVRQNNVNSRNRLIEAHMSLAAQIVGRYCTVLRSTNLSDELMSVAFEGIVQAVYMLPHDHPNPTAYIVTTIHNFVQRQGVNKNQPGERLECELPVHDSRFQELKEEIEFVLKDKMDRTILDMLIKGQPQKVIAEQLDVTPSAISQRIKAIRRRYKERQDV